MDMEVKALFHRLLSNLAGGNIVAARVIVAELKGMSTEEISLAGEDMVLAANVSCHKHGGDEFVEVGKRLHDIWERMRGAVVA